MRTNITTKTVILRAHQTPQKDSDDETGEDLIKLTIAAPTRQLDSKLQSPSPSARRSLRRRNETNYAEEEEISSPSARRSFRRRNEPNYAEDEISSPRERQISPGSNAENEGVKESNETTPLRGRSSRNQKRNFVCETTINDEMQSVKTVIRSVSRTSTRKLPLRNSILRRNAESRGQPKASSSSEEDSSDEYTPKTRSRGATYFSVNSSEKNYGRDEGNETSESDNEEEESGSSSDEAMSCESDGDRAASEERTPRRTIDLSQLTVTPDLLKKIEGRSVKRRIAVDSPVSTSSQVMSPNPEAYFLAENRLKFRKKVKLHIMNDAMKGKRRKKRPVETAEMRLPEKMASNFSVTAAAMKAVEPQNFIAGNRHEEEVGVLLANTIENEFPHWDGFNVMLYGYGSKLTIFTEFQRFVNDSYLTVSVNGLFPKLNARKLLHGICENVHPNMRVPHGASLEAVASETRNLLASESHSDVFILVNNFDNLALRSPQILTALCWLAQVPFIHILASCDTVNAFLGVTQSDAIRLKFCWMHCPTFQQYREELKWKPGIYGDESKAITQKSSLKYVLQSLTGNARKAFTLLAQMQLKQLKNLGHNKSKEAFGGVKFQELAKECREKFIAHSDESLRTLLVEFFDHKLIKQTGKGRHLETMLQIELENDTLEEVISDLT